MAKAVTSITQHGGRLTVALVAGVRLGLVKYRIDLHKGVEGECLPGKRTIANLAKMYLGENRGFKITNRLDYGTSKRGQIAVFVMKPNSTPVERAAFCGALSQMTVLQKVIEEA